MRGLRAHAFLIVIALSSRAQAFARTASETGTCVFWAERELKYLVNDRCAPELLPKDCLDAVDEAFATWTEPLCTDLKFVNMGTTHSREIGVKTADESNLVIWRTRSCADVVPTDDACRAADASCADKFDCWDGALHGDGNKDAEVIAVTTVTFQPKTGQIRDADIELNAAPAPDSAGAHFIFTTEDGPPCGGDLQPPNCPSTDIRTTLAHEIGHFMGLAHSTRSDAVMFFQSDPPGQLAKRALTDDDVAGVCTIYPRGKSVSTCLGNVTVEPVSETDGCACRSGRGANLWALIGCMLFVIRRVTRAKIKSV